MRRAGSRLTILGMTIDHDPSRPAILELPHPETSLFNRLAYGLSVEVSESDSLVKHLPLDFRDDGDTVEKLLDKIQLVYLG